MKPFPRLFPGLRLLRMAPALLALGLAARLLAAPATVYQNTFDDASALAGLETSPGNPAGEVRVEDGRLLLRGAPFSYRGAHIAIPLATLLDRPGPMKLADLAPHKITWAFNLACEDGPSGHPNGGFRIHLVSNRADPDADSAVTYSLRGGIYADDRMTLRRTGGPLSLRPSENTLLREISDWGGLKPVPTQGAFRIEYYPRSRYWEIRLMQGETAADPLRLGRDTYAWSTSDFSSQVDEAFTHFIIETENGAVSFDNLTVATYAAYGDDTNPPYQSIQYGGPSQFTFGDPPLLLPASATSGLPVSWELSGGPGMILDGSLHFTGAGVVAIFGRQGGDEAYDSTSLWLRFEVAPRPVTINLSNLQQTYRGAPHAVSASTLPADVPLLITYAGQDQPPRHAGPVQVLAMPASGDYTGSATGVLVVSKAPLGISPAPVTRLAGQANPAHYEFRFEGLAGSDVAGDLDKLPTVRTTATRTSRAGTYPVTLSGGSDADYTYLLSPGTLEVVNYGGTYEALLTAPDAPEDAPLGKVSLTVSATQPRFTGTLTLLDQPKPLPLSGELGALLPDGDVTGRWDYQYRPRGREPGPFHRLDFTLDPSRLRARLARGPDASGLTDFAGSAEGTALYRRPAHATPPWTGTHTVTLLDPVSLEPGAEGPHPQGAGYAVAKAAGSGALVFQGKLADGTTLSATGNPDPAGRHRLFLKSYGTRLNSALAGHLDLLPHPTLAGRHFVPAETGRLFWTKAASATRSPDTLYPSGFGPLEVAVTLDPWLPPLAAKPAGQKVPAVPSVTLPQRLGLTDLPDASGWLRVIYPADTGLGPSAARLPLEIELDKKGRPLAGASNPATWKLGLNPAKGTFSGSFILSDQVRPLPAKPTLRTVRFSGVLRQPPHEEDSLLGAGYFVLPALEDAAPALSAAIRFQRPPEPAPAAPPAETAPDGGL